jgi:hypothetical protein
MAQSLEVNIKTTSDVPQAMDKAKKATVSFDKQVQDIGKKFSTAFKDIFLGFTAPMVIMNGLVGMISDKIQEAKRSAQEGFDLIAEGETRFATSEQTKLANFLKVKAATEKERKDVEEGMIEMTRKFLETAEGKKFLEDEAKNRPEGASRRQLNPNVAVMYESVRQAALDAFLKSEEGKKFVPILNGEKQKDGNFKGPEGFGNVIGVGPNPVLEAMAVNTEELKKQTALLEKIAGDPGATSWMNSTPSRAALLMGK